MPDSRRPKITDEHKQEAARLRELWAAKEGRSTQAVFGEKYDLGNQSNVGHYLNGRSALNVKAAAAFAAELGCPVSAFSQRVADEMAGLGSLHTLAAPVTARAAQGESTPATGDAQALEHALQLLAQACAIAPPAVRSNVADLLSLVVSDPGANADDQIPIIVRKLLGEQEPKTGTHN